MGKLKTFARRTFLVGSAAVIGGVAFGYWKYKQPYDNPLLGDLPDGAASLTPYVKIDQGGVTIIAPRAEMGQGVHTTLAALVAEELDVDIDAVAVEHGPPSAAYFNGKMLSEAAPFEPTDDSWAAETARGFMEIPAKFMGMQITGGSSSIPDAYEKMRIAGAAARVSLVAAAAQRLGVPAEGLKTENGQVIAPDGTRLSYENLAVAAAAIEPPADPPLKPQSAWRYLGQTVPRVDMVAKSTGTAIYALDVRLPDMLHATVKINPRLGAAMMGFDDRAARSMRGVQKIVDMDIGVGVIADNTWRAFQAAEAVTCDWAKAPYDETTEDMFETVAAAFTGQEPDSRMRDEGDVDSALQQASAETQIEAEYRVPILAHATMEPMNAVVWLRDGKLDVWAGTQSPTRARTVCAAVAGVSEDAVTLHTTLMGGGFGRRAETDFIEQAVMLAKETDGKPVQVTWSRAEDMCHDVYRPLAIARFKGAVAGGAPLAYDAQIACPSVLSSAMTRMGAPIFGPDKTIVDGSVDQPYGIPNYRVTGYRAEPVLPLGFWRSVGASFNGFFHEGFMDELAHAAGADPLEMRLNLMTHTPSRKVIEAVAEMSDWGAKLPAGHGRGVAFTLSFGVPTAQVIEVAATDAGIKLERAWIAADVGTALDPGNLEAQLQGGMIFGLSAAIQGEITLENGEVQQKNFDTYDGLRLYQCPEITVRVLENGGKIRGIGEPGTPPAPAALANAIFAATGVRYRALPLNKSVDFV